MVAVVVLLLVRVLSAVNNLFGRQISLSPMERWYWRFFRIRSWAIIYAVVTPVFISRTISTSTKRWTLVLSILFGVTSYLYFISNCENILDERWRCSLFDIGPCCTYSDSCSRIFCYIVRCVLFVGEFCGESSGGPEHQNRNYRDFRPFTIERPVRSDIRGYC